MTLTQPILKFMNYACYCNTRVTGGGAVPGTEDPNDELCNDLYKCYKCINIDYDHEGKICPFFEAQSDNGFKTRYLCC